jgi:ribokinase
MILVFGSINMDIAIQVPKLPEAGETILGGDCLLSPGGKGANQAHAACLADAEAMLAGCIGRDAFAEPALAGLRKAGVDCSLVAESDKSTGCATIWVDPAGVSTIVVAPGANGDLSTSQVPESVVTDETILLLQHEVPLAENWELARRVKAKGGRVLLNAAPAAAVPKEVLPLLDFLLVNEVELAQLAAIAGLNPVGDEENPDALAVDLAAKAGTAVVATFGAEGLICSNGRTQHRLASEKIMPLDTTAAGDTFLGVFAACLDRGLTLDRCLDYANRAAALACLKSGAQKSQPSWAEITSSFSEESGS